jgi:hypothetical protein
VARLPADTAWATETVRFIVLCAAATIIETTPRHALCRSALASDADRQTAALCLRGGRADELG